MKIVHRLQTCAYLLFLISCMLPVLSADLVSNGSMEAVEGGTPLPSGWKLVDYKTGAKASIDRPGRNSEYCTKVENTAITDKANVQPAKFELKLEPGTALTISAASKARNVIKADKDAIYGIHMKLLYADGSAAWLSTQFSPGTHDWEQKDINFTVPKQVTGYEYFVAYFYNCQGTAWFDDVSLTVGKGSAAEPLRFYAFSDKSYVSADMPVPLGIGVMQSTGSGRVKDPQLSFLLPEGIDLAGFYPVPLSTAIGTPLERDGRKYTRKTLRFESLPASYPAWGTAFLTSSLPPGQECILYFGGEWDKGTQKEQAVRVTSISIPKVEPLRNFLVGPSVSSYKTLRAWPDFAGNYKAAGFNIVDLYDQYVTQSPKFDEGLFSAIKDCKAAGLKVMGDSDFLCSNPFREHLPPDAQSIGIDGKPYQRGTVVCPSYRGPALEKDQNLELVAAYIKYGASWRNLDAEPWGFAGNKICFCRRCKDGFKAYLTKNHPGISYAEPEAFVAKPAEYGKLYDAWIAYRVGNFQELFMQARERLAAECAKSGITDFMLSANLIVDKYPDERENHLSDVSLFLNSGALDYVAPMIYCEGSGYRLIGEWIRDTNSRLKPEKKKHILMYLLSGYGTYVPQPNEIREQLLETVMAGASGAIFWKFNGMNGHMFKEVAEVTMMLKPVDHMLAAGTTDLIQPMGDKVPQVETLTFKNEKLVLVSYYLTGDAVSCNVNIPVSAPSKVIDLETGQAVAGISRENSSFPVALSPAKRTRVFHIKPR